MEQRELTAPCLTRFDRVAFGAAAGLLAIVFAYLLAYGLLRTSVFDPADPAGEPMCSMYGTTWLSTWQCCWAGWCFSG